MHTGPFFTLRQHWCAFRPPEGASLREPSSWSAHVWKHGFARARPIFVSLLTMRTTTRTFFLFFFHRSWIRWKCLYANYELNLTPWEDLHVKIPLCANHQQTWLLLCADILAQISVVALEPPLTPSVSSDGIEGPPLFGRKRVGIEKPLPDLHLSKSAYVFAALWHLKFTTLSWGGLFTRPAFGWGFRGSWDDFTGSLCEKATFSILRLQPDSSPIWLTAVAASCHFPSPSKKSEYAGMARRWRPGPVAFFVHAAQKEAQEEPTWMSSRGFSPQKSCLLIGQAAARQASKRQAASLTR